MRNGIWSCAWRAAKRRRKISKYVTRRIAKAFGPTRSDEPAERGFMRKFGDAALLVVDVQRAIDAAYHTAQGPRNNPDAERNIARLLAAWREDHRTIIHIRHDSTFPQSAYRPGQEGNNFKTEVQPLPGETVISKRTNSAFI